MTLGSKMWLWARRVAIGLFVFLLLAVLVGAVYEMFARRSTSLRWSPVLRCQTLRVDGRTCCGGASGRSPTPCCPYGGDRRRARTFPLRSGRDTYSREIGRAHV